MYEEKLLANTDSGFATPVLASTNQTIDTFRGPKRSDHLPNLSIKISSEADYREVERLRKLAYSTAINFDLPDPQTVEWRNDPVGSVCLSVHSGHQYAATVRLSIARDRQMAHRQLEGQAPALDSFYPSLVIGRGATAPEFRGLGLMGFLVSIGVRVAQLAAAPSAVAVQITGTPHFRAMEAAGWQGTIIGQDNLRVVDSANDLMLVSIAKERFDQNNRFSEQKYPALHQMLKPEPILREAAGAIEKSLQIAMP